MSVGSLKFSTTSRISSFGRSRNMAGRVDWLDVMTSRRRWVVGGVEWFPALAFFGSVYIPLREILSVYYNRTGEADPLERLHNAQVKCDLRCVIEYQLPSP